MKSENEILKSAIKKLKEETDFDLDYKKNADSDYIVNLKTISGDGKDNLFVDVRANINKAIIGEISLQNKDKSQPYILATKYVSQPQAEKLRELGINFLDTAGNALIIEDNVYIFISGRKIKENKEKPLSIFRPAGAKLLFAFFTEKDLEKSDYRTIAEMSGISKTAVGRLMNDLEKVGYLVKRSNNERFLVKKSELLQRWIYYYSEAFRAKLDPVRFHSTKFEGRWWEEVNISEYNAVWSGETGGAILTKHLKPQKATIYADSMLTKLQAKYGLVRDVNGEIEILQKFWKFGEIKNVAPPLIIYADLLATADERNIETARIIYEEHLAQITEENS